MVKLFQQVVKEEMADDTFQPRNRSLAGSRLGEWRADRRMIARRLQEKYGPTCRKRQ